MKKISVPVLLLVLVLGVLLSSCTLIRMSNKKEILEAYTSENSFYRFYTFKAEVRSIRFYKDYKFFKFDVDYDYFKQAYGDDDYTNLSGEKRWESCYLQFNEYEYNIRPSSNYQLLCENGGYDLLQEGTEVIITVNSFSWVPDWQYPILSLEIDGITYLDYETGLENFLNSVRNS